ncbi:hypothetical protein [Neobacillus drentensis]|uniref:hypothetical protein n=1 Tax=Neobacillus drentensis TaxID=220684 RepID=UPI002FFFDED0
MFLRKDATKHLVIRVDELIRKTTIYAKIAFYKQKVRILWKWQIRLSLHLLIFRSFFL